MVRIVTTSASAFLLCLFLSSPRLASAALVTVEWNSGFANDGLIPDDTDSGWVDMRSVSTPFTRIEHLSVSLTVSGGYNGDLYAYLEHEGQLAVLLNRVGRTSVNPIGYDDSGFAITLRDTSDVTTDIHLYGGNGGNPVVGTFQSDGREVDPDVVLDTDAREARLTEFEGIDPNGAWTLFIADVSGGEESAVISWRLDIHAVPEPGTCMLALLGAAVWFARRRTES